ncbi:uncharacterized protein LOC123564648 [Mercenaria mercenaria]|uniref:uncharacterized protein LOC123564648 n=1 Tax=Mercenaria mercenaria TaxID=6596 RepID=UPI00234F9EFD|nr:uncharacterized protein LOC123564648 [Mercenaria mercenaria]
MTARIPGLPRDKKYHFFVCYESNSLDIVRIIVDNLEKKELICCYYERNFTAGVPILDHIHKAIRESLYMLVVLSKDFENSNFCKQELLEAKHLMVEGKYNLIPIRIEPCSVPENIRHLVYIDVEDCFDTAHVKIIDAISKQDMRIDLKQERNGESKQFKLQPYKPSRFSFTRYRLKFEESDRAELWNNEFEVSADILKALEHTVNSSLLAKYLHVWNYPFLTLCMAYLHLLILLAVFCLILFIATSGNAKTQSFQPVEYALTIGLPTLLVLFIINMLVYMFTVYDRKGIHSVYTKACRILDADIWKLSNQNNLQTGVIFFFKNSDLLIPECRKICIMRYNFKLCKTQFARYLDKRQHLKKLGESNEECTSRLFDEFLSQSSKQLGISSTVRYHHMYNGAKCVCLLVEDWLDTRKQ